MPQGAISIGSYLYLFLADSNDTDCLISAHGGFTKDIQPLAVPRGVNVYFYAPHGFLLTDPGLSLMRTAHMLEVVDHWTSDTDPTTTCDYTLSKYQNSEKTGWFRDIRKKFDPELGKHNKKTESYTEISQTILQSQQYITQMMAIVNDPTAKESRKQTARANLGTTGVMNVVAIRNRFLKSDIKLSYVIKEVHKRKPSIVNFHCSFCRGLDTEDNTPSAKVKMRG